MKMMVRLLRMANWWITTTHCWVMIHLINNDSRLWQIVDFNFTTC